MTTKKKIVLVTAGFIAGVLVLIYLRFGSEKNIASLISGNNSLIEDFEIGNELRGLETNFLASESKLKNAVNTGDTDFVKSLRPQVIAIRAELDKLQKISDDDSTEFYVDRTDSMIRQKLKLNTAILTALKHRGKAAAAQLAESTDGKTLSDSIQKNLRYIRTSRRKVMTQNVAALDKTAAKVEHTGSVSLLLVLLAGCFLFWYVVSTVRAQTHLLEQLRESEKRAQDSAKIKEKFLANMSHEIRTPMNAILGFTRLLSQKKLDGEAAMYVQTIQQSGNNLLSIVNDILDISKIEAGMLRIEPVPFSLRDLLCSVEKMFSEKAKEKGLSLQVITDETLPPVVEGDALRLTQILVNLINNAVKFTQGGGIVIEAKSEGRKEDTITVSFSVADTGIGINKEVLPTVFDRFEQADTSITREYGGTGLGLSIVKDLVRLQHGSIKAESERAKGTKITFALPYKLAQATAEATAEEKPVADDQWQKNLHVLAVEDNEINQSLLHHIFQNHKVAISFAANGEEALARLQAQTFDAILMDIQMPVMDGYTAAQKIRRQLHLSTPILAMTAHAFPGEREKCLAAGMNDYLAKPVREEQLMEMLQRQVEARGRKNHVEGAVQNGNYRFINLDYMREVSRGNTAYEKEVTQQFITLAPEELRKMEQAYKSSDAVQTSRLAHDFKTTVSVMGLNDKLNPLLEAIESEPLIPANGQRLLALKECINGALAEASAFSSALTETV